ncbi:MAG: HU family DNA-binding protein [Patescibacteria group bacterium]
MAKGLSKSQFVAALSEAWGVSKKEASDGYDKFVALVYEQVRGNGELMLPGLGKVVKQHRAARMGRNPATGEQISIAAKTVLKFRVNKAAKDAIL